MYILDEPGVRKDMADLIELGFPLKKKFEQNYFCALESIRPINKLPEENSEQI